MTPNLLMLGVGYRSNMIGLAGEAQFADYNDPSSRSSYRGQIRLYLPVGQCPRCIPSNRPQPL